MFISVSKTPEQLGEVAAKSVAKIINDAIAEKGIARVVLSTGASQFTTLSALVKEDIDWSKVEMFHLDEYVDLPITHPASFRKYLNERFINIVHPGKAHLVDGTAEGIAELTRELRSAPIDVGLIGIGENSHIAFNDPPADFDTKEAYIIVNLNDTCKKQQVGEGWFATEDDVPKQAVSMTVYQIMQCDRVISCVPYPVKANAINYALCKPESNMYPATILRRHPHFELYADVDSFSKVNPDEILECPTGCELKYE